MAEEVFHIERRRLADQIADKLMNLIASGAFKPGDKLPSEPELMKRFNVGRSSIREAIGALSLVGLLTVRPGQGTHVADFESGTNIKSFGLLGIGKEKVRELVEARIELEGIIVKLAANRGKQIDIQAIRAAHRLMKDAQKSQKQEELMQADLAFHMAIANACGNSVLVKFLSEMRQPMMTWMNQKAKFDWGYEKVYQQHEIILQAIEAGDGNKAEEALKSHLLSTGEKLISAMLGPVVN